MWAVRAVDVSAAAAKSLIDESPVELGTHLYIGIGEQADCVTIG